MSARYLTANSAGVVPAASPPQPGSRSMMSGMRSVRAVVHDELLSPSLGEFLRKRTRQDVHPAAGQERHDDADGFRRIVLSEAAAGCQGKQQRQSKPADAVHHSSSRRNVTAAFSR